TMIAYFGKHDSRTLVESVDFATGGRSPLSAREREAAGFPVGPILIVTPLCVLSKEDERPFEILSLHPGVSVDEGVANTGFELRIPGRVATTPEPTAEQLRLIREEMDPAETRRFDLLDAKSRAAMLDSILDAEWARAQSRAGVNE